MKQAQANHVAAETTTPAPAKKQEPRVTVLPYMGEDAYEGGRLTVSIPAGVLSSRDGTGLNGQAFSFH